MNLKAAKRSIQDTVLVDVDSQPTDDGAKEASDPLWFTGLLKPCPTNTELIEQSGKLAVTLALVNLAVQKKEKVSHSFVPSFLPSFLTYLLPSFLPSFTSFLTSKVHHHPLNLFPVTSALLSFILFFCFLLSFACTQFPPTTFFV